MVYFGGVDRNQSDATNSMVLLPLDRYSGTTTFLKANVSGGRLISVAVNAGVKNSAGATMPQTTRTVTDVAGTYAQLGILDAMNQLLKADTVVPATAEYQPGAARTPVMIFMSDGEPTAATHKFTQKVNAGIATGEQTVVFAVPAALIPLITYEVTLDINGNMSSLKATGAEHPIRLVYEVALQEQINELTLLDTISPEYLAANTNADGSVSFYTNQYDADNTTGYGKVNTYSYFTPSRQNDKYYYLEDAPVYTDTNGTLYTGDIQPAGTFYRRYTVYTEDGSQTVYRQLSDAALATAKQAGDGSWYIAAGNVHVNLDGYTFTKEENLTGTLTDATIPFVDAHNHSVGDLGYNFIIGATLGNNGRIALIPETGIALRKIMAEGASEPDTSFRFVITNTTTAADNSEYAAVIKTADVSQETTVVTFTDGKAIVEIDAGQTLYIGGLSAGSVYTIEEIQTLDYIPQTATFTVTLNGGQMADVTFVNADQTIGGITYDATLHTFSISVTDKDMDGQLEIHQVISTHTGNAFEINENGDWQINIAFNNRYNATGCDLVLDVLKRLENPSGSPLVSPAGFRFGLYGGQELIAVSELSDGVGEARFILHYELDDEGTYTYTLKEIIPDEKIPGMIYDETAYTLVVEVVDNGDGTMSATIVSINGEADFEPPVFTNTYKLDDVTLEVDFVDKQLTGRDLVPGEFTFELKGTDNVQHLFGTNDADGNVIFSDVLTFHAVGIYHFELRETSADGKGITTDKAVYTVIVTVTDENGRLVANYEILNLVGKDVLFENTYTTKPVTYTISGTKELTGRVLLNDEFTFVLTEADDAAGTISKDANTWEAKNFTNGSFAFAELTFTKAGTYYYTVYEKATGSADYGIRYDETNYVVAIIIEDNLEGQLYVSNVTTTIVGGDEADSITFINRYEPDPTSAQIPGSKELIGKVLSEGAFGFNLYEADENWNEIKLLESKENDANGSFTFSAIDYETAGNRFYLVKEVNDGQTIDGVIYDDTVYRVKIEVTDDLMGQLQAETFIYNEEGIPQEGILFRNLYTVTGEATVTLEGTKELVGKELTDGEFTFELYETGDSFAVSGEPIQTVVNEGGAFALTLTYKAEDVGSTRYYVVMERNAGQRIDGIAYSTAKYYVTVEIGDDGIGGIQTKTTVTNGTNTVTSLDFVNEYTTDGIEVVLDGLKTMTGRDLTEGEFTFELYETNDSWFEISGAITATNGADGSFSFPAIRFEEAQTRYYLMKEVNGGQTIDGVTYDDTIYCIIVDVTDNGLGQLEYTLDICTSEGTPVEEVTFENSYVEPPPETGDTNISMWVALMAISCGAIVTITAFAKKKAEDEI